MAAKYRTTPVLSTKMPGGIPYIIGNEAAERFSFYGMKTVLFVFMTQYLLASDHRGRDVMTPDEAKEYVHWFVASAYFFPIFGAIVSDAFWGKYRTILYLSMIYCLGHLALAVDHTRFFLLLGLTLIAIGTGAIKPCVSANVGDQFGRQNQHLVSKVFGWFYFAINLGAAASTWLTPILLADPAWGPAWAFGVPGVLMALATLVFWLGRNKFVHVPPAGVDAVKEWFSGDGLRAMGNLARIYVFVAIFWSLFDQTGSAWIQQAKRMDLRLLGVEWLPSQIQAVNPLLIMLFIPLFTYVIYPCLNRVYTLTPLRKVAIGFFLTVPAFAVPAWVETQITGGEVVKATSEGDAETWPVEKLFDDANDGTGWVSAQMATPNFPQEIVVRLREKRPWRISSVRINPYCDLKDFLAQADSGGKVPTQAEAQRCWAKDVEVLVADTRLGDRKTDSSDSMKRDEENNPVWQWSRSVGQWTLEPRNELQEFTFSPVTAEYVMIRLRSNWGDSEAQYVCLGEVEVLSPDAPPANATAYSQAVWPNVAATGHKPSVLWHVLAYVLMTAAEVMVSITCLEFSYTQAPNKMKSFIMSLYLLSVSAGNVFTATVNKFIQNEDQSSKLEGASYYWFFTAVMLAAAVGFLAVAATYRGRTYIQGEA